MQKGLGPRRTTALRPFFECFPIGSIVDYRSQFTFAFVSMAAFDDGCLLHRPL
jgi:hypothetical protein